MQRGTPWKSRLFLLQYVPLFLLRLPMQQAEREDGFPVVTMYVCYRHVIIFTLLCTQIWYVSSCLITPLSTDEACQTNRNTPLLDENRVQVQLLLYGSAFCIIIGPPSNIGSRARYHPPGMLALGYLTPLIHFI